MKKYFLIILFHILILPLVAQKVEDSASVYDGVTYTPVEGANIYNFNTNKFAFTDKNGKFTIEASPRDTIIISKSIYRQIYFVLTTEEINNQIEEYLLFYKAVLLKEVSVHSLNPSYEGFKRDLSNVKLPDIYKKIDGIEISKQDMINAEYQNRGPNVLRNTPAASPITYLYNLFSKKVKTKQLYNEMMEYEEEVDKIQNKYSRELVAEITGLKDDDLLEFMVFCRFSYYDLIRWSEEDIIKNIRSKLSDYEYYKAIEDE